VQERKKRGERGGERRERRRREREREEREREEVNVCFESTFFILIDE
jgi:hypothetical protein